MLCVFQNIKIVSIIYATLQYFSAIQYYSVSVLCALSSTGFESLNS